ncbi:EamA family transporter [Snodgrassella sp. W6238H14]|nr:EamA family transporter [Snodgrassella sp. W6238H11]MBI0161605.1 EamA family transporter [Snodgrassella sp. W6238H14]
MNLLTFMLAVISVTLNALAQIALRKTMQTLGAFPQNASDYFYFGYQLILNAWFIIGMCLYAISIGLWMAVLGKTEVSLAYPLLSIGYIITAFIGYFFLHENVNLLRIIGLVTICIGIIIISRSA